MRTGRNVVLSLYIDCYPCSSSANRIQLPPFEDFLVDHDSAPFGQLQPSMYDLLIHSPKH